MQTSGQLVKPAVEDFFCSCSDLSPLEASFFEKKESYTMYCTGVGFAPCNGVIDTNEELVAGEKDIQRIIDRFTSRNLPFIWWTPNKLLENYGFQFGGILTGVATDLSLNQSFSEEAAPEVSIEDISTNEQIATFSEIVGLGSQATSQFAELNVEAAKSKTQIHLFASKGGVPVGSVTLSLQEYTAGIWNLSVLPDYRNQGVGKALVQAALTEAKKNHYKTVMAVLMPKGMAWGIFKKLGFSEVSQFPFYVYGVAADKLE